ncbi:MAG: TonB-dependent receptor [Bacteroidetes bacterium]|nr:TonB-dependent receptor [Bacteroidota bacterium]
MKKIVLIVVYILVSISIVSASNAPIGTIRGVISDRITKTLLPGASIVLLNSSPLIGTISNADGKFRLENVNVGRVSLKVIFMGYKDVYLNNLTLNTGKELVLEIEMDENVITQQTVEIKASSDKSNTLNKMTSVSGRSFTVEETGRYAGSRNDVARMASNYAGIVGSNDARNDIIIRGNTPSGLLWRLEGVDIPNPNHWGALSATGGPVCILNNNVLSNSDFLTGAFSAEYGNAVSGVFDLKMRNGNNEKHEFLGQIGFNGFELGAEGPINKKNGSSYLINARYSTLEVMEKMGADFGTGTGIPKYKDFSMKLNFPKTKLGSFSLFAMGGISDIEMWDSRKDSTKTKVDFYGGEGYDLTNGSNMIAGGITHTLFFGTNTYTKLIISAASHKFETVVDSLSPVSKIKIPNFRNNFVENYLTASFFVNHKINSRSFVKSGFFLKGLGFSLSESIYNNDDKALRTATDFNGNTWLLQPYAEYQYKFSDVLTLNTGLHAMYYGLNKDYSIEPRAGLKWNLSCNQTLSFGYGMHSMLNSVSVYFRQAKMSDGSFKRLNEDLTMMKSQHFILGYDRNLSEYVRIKAEAYYQYLSHAAVNGGENNYYSLLNEGANFGYFTPDTLKATGTGYNYGLEFTLEHFLNKGFYYLMTASVFQSKYKGSDEIEHNTAFNGNYVLNVLIGKEFVLGHNLKDKKVRNILGFDLKTTYAGGQRYTPSTVLYDAINSRYYRDYDESKAYSLQYKDYSRTDLKIVFRRNGKKITQEFGIDIQNLFNQTNVYSEKLNQKTGETSYINQMGILIIPQYRIIF